MLGVQEVNDVDERLRVLAQLGFLVFMLGTERAEVSEAALRSMEQEADALLSMEAQRRARTISAPVNPEEVKLKLRELGHPITLFGEGVRSACTQWPSRYSTHWLPCTAGGG